MLEGVSKIKAWELGHDLVLEVYRVTRCFPRDELFGLTSQLRRAAISVPANIVEGSQRHYLKEYLQFLYISRSSLAEVEYFIFLGDGSRIGQNWLTLFTPAEFYRTRMTQISRMNTDDLRQNRC